jgi:transcriptional regulator with PAS, ATPase and Fis domain
VDDDTGFETRSMIAVPLQGKEKPIGVMEVLNKRQGSFAEKDLFFISSMASLIGLALDNAAVHTELLNAYEEQSLEVKRTQEMNARLQRELEMAHQFDQIKGKSKPMLDVLRLAEKAVHSDIPVLIQGETGTGKELLARCIHYNSQRKHKPFLIQNCSAVSEQMLSSELFGHVQGAFGGAVGSKRGLLEAADGGTVFLDDIARMPQSVQLALLRVMDTGEIWPLGSEEPVQVDVRLIASVNKNLERFVKKDKFREDLFYRLSPFTLVIPPLRKRPEDIPVLAQHFVEELNEKNNTSIKGISRKAMNYLSTYPFPGNVRELKNEIERSIAMLDRGKLIDVRHLSEKLRGKTTPKLTRVPNAKGTTLKEKVEALEKAEIVRILGKNRGNKTATANELGLSRLGLSKKIKRYELQ